MKQDPSTNRQAKVEQLNHRQDSPSRNKEIQDTDILGLVFSESDSSENKQPSVRLDKTEKQTSAPSMYEDEHGIPVMYDSATQERQREDEQQKQDRNEDISILWHELLSPLTVIKAYTSTLLQLGEAITDEEKKQYIQRIDTASNRVIRLLENLRDITRIQENDVISVQQISMFDLISTIVSEVQSQTMEHIIKIRRPSRMPLVQGDPEKIEQVINNLLTNAIKYSPQGGDIEAEIQVIHSEHELRKMFGHCPEIKLPCIVVSISDNGIGVPESELTRIFDRFHRVKNKLTHTISGAGLGLYICRIIIEAHGGYIWARNRIQRGSVFSFSLPLR